MRELFTNKPSRRWFFKFAIIGCTLVTMISAQHHHSPSPISVRSHGEARKAKSETKTFQSVIGPLDLVPRNRLRVIRRNEPNNDETIQAAKAAGLVAKNLQEKTSRQRIDFDLSDNKFSPVSFPHFFFLCSEIT